MDLFILERSQVQGAAAAQAQEGQEELLHIRGQGRRPGVATLPPRSGAVAEGATPRPRPGASHKGATPCRGQGHGRKEPPHAQGVVAARAQEGLEELSHVEGQEGQQ